MTKGRKDIVKDEDQCCEADGKLNLPASIRDNLERIGGLDLLIEELPPLERFEGVSKVHQALSDPARLRILAALSRCDLCPCILKIIVSQSDSKLSYHLDVLEEVGLVRSIPEKKWRIYSLTDMGREMLEQAT